MDQLFLGDTGATKAKLTLFQESIEKSLLNLFSLIEKHGGSNELRTALNSQLKEKSGRILSSIAHSTNYALVHSIKAKVELKELQGYCTNLLKRGLYRESAEVRIAAYDNSTISDLFVNLVEKDSAVAFQNSNEYEGFLPNISPPEKEVFATQIATIQDAFKTLNAEAIFPFLDEPTLLVEEICLFNAPHVLGWSSPRHLGTIFIAVENRKKHAPSGSIANSSAPLFYIEQIIHEVSHTQLDIHSSAEKTKLFKDNRPIFKSPIRKDPRTLFGIFHGVFVMARIALTLDTLYPNKISCQNTPGRIDDARRIVKTGCATLLDNNQLCSDFVLETLETIAHHLEL